MTDKPHVEELRDELSIHPEQVSSQLGWIASGEVRDKLTAAIEKDKATGWLMSDPETVREALDYRDGEIDRLETENELLRNQIKAVQSHLLQTPPST